MKFFQVKIRGIVFQAEGTACAMVWRQLVLTLTKIEANILQNNATMIQIARSWNRH